MTERRTRARSKPATREAVVWIDHDQAVILGQGSDGSESVELLGRESAQTRASFEADAVREVGDEDRIVVTGPAFARTEFERAYVALTHRPDRLIDVEPTTPSPRKAKRTV